MNELIMFGLVCVPFTLGYFVGRAVRGKAAPVADALIENRIIRDIDSVPAGSLLLVTYSGFFTYEQRTAIREQVRAASDGKLRALVLEGGIKATLVQEGNSGVTG